MTDLAQLKKANDARWKRAKITRPQLFQARAAIAYKNKARYMTIVHRLQKLGSNMPDDAYVFLAVTHERESSMNFNTHLGQGDPLTNKNGVPIKTVHVPAGRGPFSGPTAFEDAAVDALWYCAPYAAKNNKDWTISGILTYLERYNGLGYANRGVPSPYLWAGTDQYVRGKYIADGVYSATAVDSQPGCAGLLLALDAMDPDVDFSKIVAPTFTNPDEILYDDTIHDAAWLQRALNKLGAVPKLDVDGIYGMGTRNAVRVFQRAHGLTVDGIAGEAQTIPVILRELKALETV